MATKTYTGSCHCGAIKYQADIDLSQGTQRCNCTYCAKIRSWKTFIKPEAFKLLSENKGTGYSGQNPTAVRYFCGTCGAHTYEIGDAEWMGGPFVGIFVNSLDATVDELMSGPLTYADGLHDNWMEPAPDTRHL